METKGGLKGFILTWLGIQPASHDTHILVHEAITHEANVLKNQLWYRGDPMELEQFYKQLAENEANIYSTVIKSKFWASVPNGDVRIRKIHSGLPAMMVDILSDIVVGDMLEPNMDEGLKERWGDFCKENEFRDLLVEAIQKALVTGDGAFKINVDTDLSEQPLIEFYGADQVCYEYKRGKLQAVIFKTEYCHGNRRYQLHERYGKGTVQYKLFGPNKKEYKLDEIPETTGLEDVTFTGNYIMAVPLKIYKCPKYKDRGQSIFDKKADAFDALDETLSTWLDGVRASRVKQYIPENMIPKDKEGIPLKPDVFNPWIAVNGQLAEEDNGKIETVQGDFQTASLLESYITFLDVCLQGILSPSTLGIDVKKLDNADAQREKEKTTMYTRDTIINALQCTLQQLFDAILRTQDNMLNKQPPEDGYKASFEWGQYANPSFEAMVETLVKAKTGQIMSTKRIVDELYGDDLSEEEKAEEVALIMEEYGGATAMEEPMVGDGDLFGDEDGGAIDEGNTQQSETAKPGAPERASVPDGGEAVQGGAANSQKQLQSK